MIYHIINDLVTFPCTKPIEQNFRNLLSTTTTFLLILLLQLLLSSFLPGNMNVCIGIFSQCNSANARECHGFLKPAGFAAGFSGVRVWVGNSVPPKNPYPWHGFRVTHDVTHHIVGSASHGWTTSTAPLTTLEIKCSPLFELTILTSSPSTQQFIDLSLLQVHCHQWPTAQTELYLGEYWTVLRGKDM